MMQPYYCMQKIVVLMEGNVMEVNVENKQNNVYWKFTRII